MPRPWPICCADEEACIPTQHSPMTADIPEPTTSKPSFFARLPPEVWAKVLSCFDWTEFLRLTTGATSYDYDTRAKAKSENCWSQFRSVSSLAVRCMVNSIAEETDCEVVAWSWLVKRLFEVNPATLNVVEYLWVIAVRLHQTTRGGDEDRRRILQSNMRMLISSVSETSWMELEPFFEKNSSYVDPVVLKNMKRNAARVRRRKQQQDDIRRSEGIGTSSTTRLIEDIARPYVTAAILERRYDILLNFKDEADDVASIVFDHHHAFSDDKLEEMLRFIVDEYGSDAFHPATLYMWVDSTRWLSILHERIHLPYTHLMGMTAVESDVHWSARRYLLFQVGVPFDPDEVLRSLRPHHWSQFVTEIHKWFETVVQEVAFQGLTFNWTKHLTDVCGYRKSEYTVRLLDCLLRNHRFTSDELSQALDRSVDMENPDLKVLVKLFQAGAIWKNKKQAYKSAMGKWPLSVKRIFARYHGSVDSAQVFRQMSDELNDLDVYDFYDFEDPYDIDDPI